MCHVVPFSRSSLDGRVMTEIIITYDSQPVLPSFELEKVSRVLLEHLVLRFAYTDILFDNGHVDPDVLSSVLLSEGVPHLSEWVAQYEFLSVNEISSDETSPSLWIVFQ